MHASYLSGPARPPGGSALPTLAPIDDGSDAPDMAERLLRAAPLLTEAWLGSHFAGGHFDWHGRMTAPQRTGGTLHLRGPHLVADVDLAAVLAVSYCADASSSGICMFDEGGAFLTLWSTEGDAFDAWLESTVGGYACQVARRASRLGASPRPARLPAPRTSRAP
jgi:hypothetical protein